MDPFSAAFLTTLAGKLTGNVAASLTGPLKRQIAGTPAQQAVERSLRVALVALAAQATAAEPEQATLLRDIFEQFFHHPLVWLQIGGLLKDRPLDHTELRDLFADAGYDAATLPNLDFDVALGAFEVAFVEVADGEKELQGIIQIGQLRRQTEIQTDLLTQVKDLVAFLQQTPAPLAVDSGQLRAASGQPVYHFSGNLQGAIINIESSVSDSEQSTAGSQRHKARLDEQLRPYLETVVRRSGRLPLGPLNPGGHDTAHLALLKVFINLDAGEKVVHENGLLRRYTAAVAHAHEDERLIVLGDPGSGKSTLFRYLSFCLASHRLNVDAQWLANLSWNEERLPVPPGQDAAGYATKFTEYRNRREREWAFERTERKRSEDTPEEVAVQWADIVAVPISIELRNFAQSDFEPQSPVAFWKFFAEQLEREDLAGAIPALKELAQRGEALFLFDGVDEVPPGRRPDIWRAIAALANGPYGGCRWIAACRVLSFVPDEAPATVPVQTLSPLTEKQIDAFVTNWYAALTEGGERVPPRAAENLGAATQRPRLRTLARNPMLLTIMALVQTYYGTLPDERARLYQQCVETLLLRWQRHKEESDREMPGLLAELGTNQQELERLLWEIAWQAHSQAFRPDTVDQADDEEQAADIPESEVMAAACRALGSWGRAEQFIEYTESRAHLLLGRGGVGSRLFTFPHRTFQEYLAACHLASDRRPGERARELAQQGDYWREVLNLATGTLVFNQNNREKALDAIAYLLPATPPSGDDVAGWRRVWLAGEMADVVGQEATERDNTGREFLPRLREQLAALVGNGYLNPVQRAAAGLALGRLGDPRPDVMAPVPVTVLIPPGEFIMGSERRKGQPGYDELSNWDDEATKEGARFQLALPTYKIGKYPVTVAQFARFVDGQGYETERYWTPAGWARRKEEKWVAPRLWDDPTWNVDNHPVIGVSWYEAVAYCAWLTATNPGHFFRLPDEAMWEKAARGTDGRRWPWGDTWDATRLNAEQTIGRTSAVGIFPAGRSPYGIHDCAGNVLEWCSGPGYNSGVGYPFEQRAYEEDLRLRTDTRALRGGSWFNLDRYSRAAYRSNSDPNFRLFDVGFRVAELLSDPES
jgi:formylglycine-generating enzyme required for sulfatase activity